ncbi:hypothetical protein D9758_001597 [Tetrapyrgos nigripes]|uniref:DUF1766-domain-containing protein n=1 Tax=Tetrapyrgos nigripes TaxID=182062 RepID=A0A8H5GXF2_9AGAR|nr:hypothetical protein D9758_001597 [Tetrapyrgos nigripes]
MGKAKRLLRQWLLDDDDDNKKPNGNGGDQLAHQFASLNVSTPNVPQPAPQPTPQYGHHQFNGPTFVGGFHMPSAPSTTSLTMQYALNNQPHYLAPPPLPRPPRAVSDPPPSFPNPVVFDPGFDPGSLPPSPARPPARPSISSASPPKPARLRASSTPPSPIAVTSSSNSASTDDVTQCSGVTKTGKRCTRQVKKGPAITGAQPDDKSVERFCHQHTKELLNPSGFYVSGTEWIDFVDYIPDYLSPDTQVALRVEMEKARSSSDVEGYIYAFEIRDPDDKKNIKLKVGRTVNVVKRLNEWSKQCGSKEQVLRGWFPGAVEDDDDDSNASLMKGRVRAGGQGVWCHRLERLIHLELADLAVNGAYLEPGWKPFIKGPGKGRSQQIQAAKTKLVNSSKSSSTTSSPPSTPTKSKKHLGLGNGGGYAPCKDCGSIHKEIFQFARFGKGRNEGREWELVVKAVCEGWTNFVKDFVK